MNEYVTQDEIDQRLGLTPESTTLEPGDNHEAGSAGLEETKASPELVAKEDMKQTRDTELGERLAKTEQERNAAITKVKTLEQEGKTTNAQVKGLHAELEAAENGAKATKAELEQTRAKLEDTRSQLRENERIVSGLHSKVETLEAEIEAARCPKCGKIVGWGSQVKELPESQFKKIGEPPSIFPFDFSSLFSQKTVRFRECPQCGHIQKV